MEINIIRSQIVQGENGYFIDRVAMTVNPSETVEGLVRRCLTYPNGDKIKNLDATIEIRLPQEVNS